MRRKIHNIFYAPIFTFDVDDIKREFKTVGMDFRYRTYVLEICREMNRSAVFWCESEYRNITFSQMLDFLEKAYKQGKVALEQYQTFKECEQPNESMIKNIEEVYKSIAESFIRENRKSPLLDSTKVRVNLHSYINYHYTETKPFEKFYLNRYSLNQGWCVRINKNQVGYKLIVIYSPKELPELFEDNQMNDLLERYYSNAGTYYSIDVKEKQLTNWEFAYIIDLLEKSNFYNMIKSKMDLSNNKIVGCTGSCNFKISYDDALLEGLAEIDDKYFCGVDFFGIIQKLNCM